MITPISNLFLLVGPLSLFIQIALCIHVYRTGRPYWWIWLIMMGSLIGCILYVLLEILPAAGRINTRGLSTSWLTPKSVIIRRTTEQLEETDTIKNRLDLAALLYGYGKKDAAEQVVSNCAHGPFKDDPDIIAEVAWYKMAAGKSAEAETLIQQANTKNNKLARNRIELIKARILIEREKYQEALSVFTSLQTANLGEEPRYYMALCHIGLRQAPEALKVLHDITKRYRKGGKIWRRSEKAWFIAANQKLKEIKSNPKLERRKPSY